MPGKKLSPLTARKQLLIAESELNRSLLAREAHALRRECLDAGQNIAKSGAVVLSAGALFTLIKAFWTRKKVDPKPPPTWLPASLKLLRLGLPFFLGFWRRKKTTTNSNGHTSPKKTPPLQPAPAR